MSLRWQSVGHDSFPQLLTYSIWILYVFKEGRYLCAIREQEIDRYQAIFLKAQSKDTVTTLYGPFPETQLRT